MGKTVPHRGERTQMRKESGGIWSGLLSFSGHPLPDQCLFHLRPTHRTELPTCPRPQLMVVLIKEAVRGGPLCWSPW